MLKIASLGLVLSGMMAGPLMAKTKLEDDPEARPKIIAVAEAEEIAANCKSLKLNAPVMMAMPSYFAIGEPSYSVAEYKAALDALRPHAHEALLAKGAVAGKSRTYCAIGKAEKRANTMTGRLFK